MTAAFVNYHGLRSRCGPSKQQQQQRHAMMKLSASLQYIMASLLGCSLSIFLFTTYSMSQLYDYYNDADSYSYYSDSTTPYRSSTFGKSSSVRRPEQRPGLLRRHYHHDSARQAQKAVDPVTMMMPHRSSFGDQSIAIDQYDKHKNNHPPHSSFGNNQQAHPLQQPQQDDYFAEPLMEADSNGGGNNAVQQEQQPNPSTNNNNAGLLQERIAQRRQERQSRNQARRKQEHAEKIAGSIFYANNENGDVWPSPQYQYHTRRHPKRARQRRQRRRRQPQSLLGQWIRWMSESLLQSFFGDDDNDDDQSDDSHRHGPELERDKKPPPHPDDALPILYNAQELAQIRRHRIAEFEKQGIFYNYSQTPIRTNTTLPLPTKARQPAVNLTATTAAAANDATVAVLVLSSRTNFDHRQAIRETWGKNHSVYFVIGGRSNSSSVVKKNTTLPSSSNDEAMTKQYNNHNHSSSAQEQEQQEETRLRQELDRYGDLLDSIHPESYMSLPYKLQFGYQWILEYLPSVQWIVKADDDTVVRVETLQQALLRLYNPQVPMVLGKIVIHSRVNRQGKWAEFVYPKDIYPYWPQGSRGHVVSRPVAEYVAHPPHPLVYYQGEDTSLGIWLDESPLQPHVMWIHSPFFQNHGQCQDEEALIIGHKLSPDDIRNCYQQLDEWEPGQYQLPARRLIFTESKKQRRDVQEQQVSAFHSTLRPPSGRHHHKITTTAHP